MKFSCVIVDDEPLAHEVLRSHLSKTRDVELVESFYNGREAENYLRTNRVDLIFADIQMPEMTGLQLLRALPVRPVSILCTAHREFAMEGYDIGVIDYLLKPVSFERFEIAVQRALDFLRLELAASLAMKCDENYNIQIKTGTRRLVIDYRTIDFAQGLKDYTILHAGKARYVVKGSVKAFEEFLSKDHFMRFHKSFIVAKVKIRSIRKQRIELADFEIPIGGSYRKKVEEFLRNQAADRSAMHA